MVRNSFQRAKGGLGNSLARSEHEPPPLNNHPEMGITCNNEDLPFINLLEPVVSQFLHQDVLISSSSPYRR